MFSLKKFEHLGEVYREGEFRNLGFLYSITQDLLIPFYDLKLISQLEENNNIKAIVTNKSLVSSIPKKYGIIIAKNPLEIFFKIHLSMIDMNLYGANDISSSIDSSAKIHSSSYISSKGVSIGKNCLIEPNVTIHKNTLVGDNVIIRSGAVIGNEGFEVREIDGKIITIPHIGGVKIGGNVEIQANCNISRSLFGGYTEIKENTKLDAHIHIAHNAIIGRNVKIAAQATICGGVTIEDNVWIGPNSTISNGVSIRSNAYITLGSIVTKNVEKDMTFIGGKIIDNKRFKAIVK